ncbi:MAG: fumarylacetoacetate hydrolase family protein, partial [Burkholderiales bacterium]
MKLISFQRDSRSTWGAVVDAAQDRDGALRGGVVDLGRRLPQWPQLIDCLRADGLAVARGLAVRGNVELDARDLRLLRPIPYPEKILCVGVNYAERNEEYRDGSDAPKYPSLFVRAPDSLGAHRDALLRPPESEQLDYEGEITIVIGKAGRRIPAGRAREHV